MFRNRSFKSLKGKKKRRISQVSTLAGTDVLVIYLPSRNSIKIRPELLRHRVISSQSPSRADSGTTDLIELVLFLSTCLGIGLASWKTAEKKAHK